MQRSSPASDCAACDCIVIGSGISGLSCALLLARQGKKVVVLEQHSRPAPVIRGFRRKGIYFDSGFHYVGGLGQGGPMLPLLRHLGLAPKLELIEFNQQGFDCLHSCTSGERVHLPVGFANIRAELSARFPAAAPLIHAHIDTIEANWSAVPYLDLDLSLEDVASPSVHGTTLAEALAPFAAWPELQGLLSMHTLLYGIDPGEALVSLNAQVAGSYYHSAHGIKGGGEALVHAYTALLAAAGVEVRCQAEVKQILVQDGAVYGVELSDATQIQAPEVVASVNPALLPAMLPEGAVRPAYLKRLRNLRQTGSAYVLFGACSKPAAVLQGCNLFAQSKAGLMDPGQDQPLEQRPLYLTAAGSDAGPDAPASGIIAIVPAHYAEVAAFRRGAFARAPGYAEQKARISAAMCKRIRTCCPEIEGLEALDLATPLTLEDYSMAPHGAIYGVGRFAVQYNPQAATRVAGLYLSGQAIAAPGLMGAMVSAYMTCGTILGHDLLRGELKQWR
ncbi:MAG: NAD(P)/FAD-dependent oxidoreductase [Geobacteraceae bacterium]|nr:NAD(P)/FAD-dependent oxidoreductase [Geobacteraceae bacterium]